MPWQIDIKEIEQMNNQNQNHLSSLANQYGKSNTKKIDSKKSQLSCLRYLCHFLELGVHPVIRLLGKVKMNDLEKTSNQQQSSARNKNETLISTVRCICFSLSRASEASATSWLSILVWPIFVSFGSTALRTF